MMLLILTTVVRAEELFPQSSAFPFDVTPSTASANSDKPSRFVQQAALRMDWPEEKLHKLERNGFARTEMILLVLMAKKTEEKWDDLIKERERGKPLRKMAENRTMPYNDLFRKAGALKADIDAAVEALPPEVEKSTDTLKK